MVFDVVIGLEVHVQLNTNSKIFSSDENIFGKKANTLIHPISCGYPGTLPKVNLEAVKKAITIGLACGCEISSELHFSRKHYFYPDLPKGYQITQFDNAICTNGFVEISSNDQIRKIRLRQIHLEEDAGKSIHDLSENNTSIDLNRAGVPLVEIVTEADMTSAEEAYNFLKEIRDLVRYLGISDGDMEKGSLRCDGNISLKPAGSKILGSKVEIKNVNSMRFLRTALDAEIKRQTKLLEANTAVVSHTRAYNEETNDTFPTRAKEAAHDYRYFPEPDLPAIKIDRAFVNQIKSKLPESRKDTKRELKLKYGLSENDAELLISDKGIMNLYEQVCNHTKDYKTTFNLLLGPVRSYLMENNLSVEQLGINSTIFADIIKAISNGVINFNLASKKLFPELLKNPNEAVDELLNKLNLTLDNDVSSLQQLILEVVNKYPDKVDAYLKGKKGVVELFMGEVMRASKGKADPKISRKLINTILNSKKG